MNTFQAGQSNIDAGWFVLFFALGCSIAGLCLIFASSKINSNTITPIFGICLLITALLNVIVSILFQSNLADPTVCLCFIMGLLGLAFPFSIAIASLALKDIKFRIVLINVYAMGITFALACFLIEKFNRFSLTIAAISTLLGAIGLLVALHLGFSANGKTEEDSSVNPAWKSKSYLVKYLFLSMTAIGLFDYFFTSGLARRVNSEPLLSNAMPALVIGLCCIAISFFARKHQYAHDNRLPFELFELALPSVAAFSLIIKLVPIALVSDFLFANYTHFAFQLFTIMTFLNIANLSSGSVEKSLFFSGSIQLAVVVASVGGCFFGGLSYPLNDFALGIVTAISLVYLTLSLGRNVILFASGFTMTEKSDDSMPAIPGSSDKDDSNQQQMPYIKSRCDALAQEYNLTPREKDVLIELAHGYSPAYIAKAFYLSINTIKSHNKNIYRKLGVSSRYELYGLLFHPETEDQTPS